MLSMRGQMNNDVIKTKEFDMKLLIAFMAFSILSFASITTKIVKVLPPLDGFENQEVLALYDGKVFDVSPENVETLELLKYAAENDELVKLEFEKKNYFVSPDVPQIIASAKILEKKQNLLFPSMPYSDYKPTNLTSMAKADSIFKNLLVRSRWFTECFNRALIWNRQMDKEYGVKSEKIFIFYTRKFRSAYPRWKWWFHVAPLVTVNGEKTVMDKEFAATPLSTEDWEKKFNKAATTSNYRCKRMDRISTYYNDANNITEYCNIQISPMYYWEPSQLRKLEEENAVKTGWIDWEIRSAAQDVFRNWSYVYDRLKID